LKWAKSGWNQRKFLEQGDRREKEDIDSRETDDGGE
jgi:hypothetical protein